MLFHLGNFRAKVDEVRVKVAFWFIPFSWNCFCDVSRINAAWRLQEACLAPQRLQLQKLRWLSRKRLSMNNPIVIIVYFKFNLVWCIQNLTNAHFTVFVSCGFQDPFWNITCGYPYISFHHKSVEHQKFQTISSSQWRANAAPPGPSLWLRVVIFFWKGNIGLETRNHEPACFCGELQA